MAETKKCLELPNIP